ncbi:32310_t:CDS:2, partial [Racocetra persica]
MQLGLFRLRQALREHGADENDFNNAETLGILVYKNNFYFYSMHYSEGLYLTDKFDEFAIPTSASQLRELSEIIRSMFYFKHRVVNLHRNMQNLLKGKREFRQKSRHC